MKAIAHIKLLMALLLVSCSCVAQNLVPNYSFEDNPTCGAGITNAPPWFNPAIWGTPDCWISCSLGSISGVPDNWFGYQPARTGVAYAGLAALLGINDPLEPNQREYIEVPLDSALIAGKKYCVRFYVNLGDSSKYATSSMGAFLSVDSIISDSHDTLPFIPQISNPLSNTLTDKVNWVLISGEYTALGGEKFITIGNFSTNANSNIAMVNGGYEWGYYFIEDVYVGICDTVIPATIYSVTAPNIFTPNNDGINAVFKITTNNITILNCKIYNRWGILISELTKINEAWDGLTTSGLQCADGVYYYLLTAIGEDGKKYDEKGFVSLIR